MANPHPFASFNHFFAALGIPFKSHPLRDLVLLGWSHETIRLRDAESAILVQGGRFGRKRLRIEGDKVALEIGQGLKTRDLEWLRDYLIYAAVRA